MYAQFAELGMLDTSECIRLKAQLDLAAKCEEAATIWNVPLERRSDLLEDVCSSLDFIPGPFQQVLLRQAVKDNQLLTIGDVEKWELVFQTGEAGVNPSSQVSP